MNCDIKIYQINRDRDENKLKYNSFSGLTARQKTEIVNSSIYDNVYEGTVEADNLEEIYRIFNVDRPENYIGESMTVSDVVEIVSGNEKIDEGFYYCDEIGFTKVEFDPEKVKQLSCNTIRVVYLEPGKLAEIKDIDSSLEGMQKVVHGFIEAAYYFDGPECLVVNDEGKINEMELNRGVFDSEHNLVDIIAGPAFICDCSGESFGSLDEERLNKYKEMFKYPETFFRLGDEIRAMKYNPEKDSKDISDR